VNHTTSYSTNLFLPVRDCYEELQLSSLFRIDSVYKQDNIIIVFFNQ